MIPASSTAYSDRVKAAQCCFAKAFATIRYKRCFMIPVDIEEHFKLHQGLVILNSYDPRDFDLTDPTWNALTKQEIYEILLEVEKILC